MIGKLASVLLLASVAFAGSIHVVRNNYAGVDPNALACDAEGLIHLLLPHFEDCNKFYSCAHGIEVESKCPDGLIFDFELQVCNWAFEATCILRGEDSSDGDGDIEGSGYEPEIEGSGYEPEIDGESRGHFSDVVINCSLAKDASRQVAYTGDCQRFWRCVDGLPVASYCTDGLFFNEAKQMCDFEDNVRCLALTEEELGGEFLVY